MQQGYMFFLWIVLMFHSIQGTAQEKIVSWPFPINRTHAGVLLGNGVQGLMVWGGDNILNITVGHAGFWDHRGGNDFASRANFAQVKNLVQQNDEPGLRKLFFYIPKAGEPDRPQQLSAGMCQIKLPKSYTLTKADLNLLNGTITVFIKNSAGKTSRLQIEQSIYTPVSFITLPVELVGKIQSTLMPMWQFNSTELKTMGIVAPEIWRNKSIEGFTQTLPQDEPLAMAQYTKGSHLLLATNVGVNAASKVTGLLQSSSVLQFRQQAANWWKNYWGEVARISIPDKELQEVYDYGLYKQACATPPHGLACTLQGAFMEEYQLPPWSNDFHFNINAQLIYTPALATNRPQHFKPLLELLDSLMPVFRRNGQLFFENPDAIMFPHAVDDRGQAIGNYWGGTMDHATTAWVALLTWQYYQYTGDTSYLQRLTYPLLAGAFEGFWSMMETGTDSTGKRQFGLPISVSPEYGGGLEGVGRNSSFQLAALHRVLNILPEAAKLLKINSDKRWSDVKLHLPEYSVVTTPYGESSKNMPARIGLWDGKDLEISHRHHSHLAGIYPFQTLDVTDTAHSKIIEASYWRWVHAGAGGWSGWCIPWASIIHNRMGNTEAAVSWLHYWKQNFVNEGRGTLHNTTNLGMGTMNEPIWAKEIGKGKKNHEIMQLDAGLGAVSAILDLLVQETDNGIYILPNRHWNWKNVSFQNIRTVGGFLIAARVINDRIISIKIKATSNGKLKLYPGMGEPFLLNGAEIKSDKLEIEMSKGEIIELKPTFK